MWRISSRLNGQCVYQKQRIEYCDVVRASIKEISMRGHKVSSAYIGAQTRIVYRSESSRMVWFIQMSAEMWHFEETGQVIFHKMINSLLPNLFKRWSDTGAHHVVTIVLFTSIDVSKNGQVLGHGEVPTETKDYFRVVVDQVHTSQWNEIMERLRYEFFNFDKEVLLDEDGKIQGKLLPAVKGNLLQAISIATSLASKKFVDRDLRRTGVQTVIITPCAGLFDVNYDLLYQTSLKLQTIEIGVDLLCIGKPPLHVTPLFRYKDKKGLVKHCVPTWLDISYWEASLNVDGRQWIPRCKIYELQMMGMMEDNMSPFSIEPLPITLLAECSDSLMMQYDDAVFSYAESPKKTNKKLEPTLNYSKPKPSISDPKVLKEVTAVPVFIAPTSDTESQPGSPELRALSSESRNSILKNILKDVLENNSPSTSHTLEPVKSDSHHWPFAAKTSTSSLRSLYLDQSSSKSKPVENDQLLSKLKSLKQEPRIPSAETKPLPPKPVIAPTPDLDSSGTQDIKLSFTKAATQRRPPISRYTSNFVAMRRRLEAMDSAPSSAKEREIPHFMWQSVENPSRHIDIDSTMSYGRWKFVYPPHTKQRAIKWRSLNTPASLPLVTLIFPSTDDLYGRFKNQTYDATIYPGESNYKNTFELLEEMVAIRLALGFQIVYRNSARDAELQNSTFRNPNALVEVLEPDAISCRIYMTMGNQIHRLSWDLYGSLNVQMYTNESLSFAGNFGKKYHPYIKTQYAEKYAPATIDFFSNNLKNFNWNTIDRILMGNQHDIIEDQGMYTLRLIMVPVEIPSLPKINGDILSVEETRLEGLKRFLSMLYKNRYFTPKERNQVSTKSINTDAAVPEIVYYTGSIENFLEKQLEPQETNNIGHITERFTKDTATLSVLAQEMQTPKTGLIVSDIRWHWKMYKHCFQGSNLVSWLLRNFEDISTEEEAEDYGNELMRQGLFVHAENRHPFRNGHYMYRFTAPYRHTIATATTVADSGSTKQIPVGTTLPKVKLSKAINYNLDTSHPPKSTRPENLIVHVDLIHNPKNGFHVRFEWLNCTPKLIDETINNIAKLVDRYGLRLYQVPIGEIGLLEGYNPFVSLVHVPILHRLLQRAPESHPLVTDSNPDDNSSTNNKSTVSLVEDEEMLFREYVTRKNPKYLHKFILRRLGYILDTEPVSPELKAKLDISYSWGKPSYRNVQYLHNSGLGLVQVIATKARANTGVGSNKGRSGKPAAKLSPKIRVAENDTNWAVTDCLLQDYEFIYMPNFLVASKAGFFFSGTQRTPNNPYHLTRPPPPSRGNPAAAAAASGDNSTANGSQEKISPESLLQELRDVCSQREQLMVLVQEARRAWRRTYATGGADGTDVTVTPSSISGLSTPTG